MCTRGSWWALLGGPSTSPLEVMRSNLRTLALCLGIGVVLAILHFIVGAGLELGHFFKAATVILWPYIMLKPLAPCLPAGDPNCVGDTIQSGVFFLSFGLSVGMWSLVTYGVLRMTSYNRWRGP